jgi:SAM-dependent methyltransferase
MARRRERRPLTASAWLRWDAIEGLLPRDATRVLDVGTGQGTVGSFLAERYDYVGIEPDPVSWATARRRIGNRGTVLNCTIEELPRSPKFDLVCSFEVLEHLEDDAAALTSWTNQLHPGGWVLVSVPLGRERFGAEDRRVGHFRRYDVADVEELFRQATLEYVAHTVYGSPLGNLREAIQNAVFTVRPSERSIAERTAESGRLLEPAPWLAAATHAVALPFRYLQRPLGARGIGTGIVALGRLPTAARTATASSAP